MTLSKYERETIITYSEDTDKADVYTCSKSIMRKLDKMCDYYPDTYRLIGKDEYSATYECPINRIRFANPVSDKQKQANYLNGIKAQFRNGENAVKSD